VDEKRPLRGLGKGAGLLMTHPKRPRDPNQLAKSIIEGRPEA
jgi:hypothetical protein